MKTTFLTLFFFVNCLVTFAQINKKKTTPPTQTAPIEKAPAAIESKPNDKMAKAGNIEVSVIKVEGDKATKRLKINLGLKNIGEEDLQINSTNIVVIDNDGNQLKPRGFNVELLIKGVFTKDSFLVTDAFPEVSNLSAIKITSRIFNPLTRKSDNAVIEFRNIEIDWK